MSFDNPLETLIQRRDHLPQPSRRRPSRTSSSSPRSRRRDDPPSSPSASPHPRPPSRTLPYVAPFFPPDLSVSPSRLSSTIASLQTESDRKKRQLESTQRSIRRMWEQKGMSDRDGPSLPEGFTSESDFGSEYCRGVREVLRRSQGRGEEEDEDEDGGGGVTVIDRRGEDEEEEEEGEIEIEIEREETIPTTRTRARSTSSFFKEDMGNTCSQRLPIPIPNLTKGKSRDAFVYSVLQAESLIVPKFSHCFCRPCRKEKDEEEFWKVERGRGRRPPYEFPNGFVKYGIQVRERERSLGCTIRDLLSRKRGGWDYAYWGVSVDVAKAVLGNLGEMALSSLTDAELLCQSMAGRSKEGTAEIVVSPCLRYACTALAERAGFADRFVWKNKVWVIALQLRIRPDAYVVVRKGPRGDFECPAGIHTPRNAEWMVRKDGDNIVVQSVCVRCLPLGSEPVVDVPIVDAVRVRLRQDLPTPRKKVVRRSRSENPAPEAARTTKRQQRPRTERSEVAREEEPSPRHDARSVEIPSPDSDSDDSPIPEVPTLGPCVMYIAITPDIDLADALMDLQERVAADFDDFVRSDDFHLTLLYLGKYEAGASLDAVSRAIHGSLSNVEPITIPTDPLRDCPIERLGENSIVKILPGVMRDQWFYRLRRLQSALRKGLQKEGLLLDSADRRVLRPHITLGEVESSTPLDLGSYQLRSDPVPWVLDCVRLVYREELSRYPREITIPFAGAPI